MIKLNFSIEDILRDESRKGDKCQKYSRKGGKNASVSDGESTRSESPDSTTSTGSEDIYQNKSNRRMRTPILSWQKFGLENAFSQQRYPTVQYLDRLSDELGLPHCVTKVWFQNRRSKLRKEAHSVRQSQTNAKFSETEKKQANMNLNAHPIPVVNVGGRRNSHEDVETRLAMPKPLFQERQPCSCPECMQRGSEERRSSVMPVLVRENVPDYHHPAMEQQQRKQFNTCNCNTCYLKSENEARMRFLNEKPRFDDRFTFVPRVSVAAEKQQVLNRNGPELRSQGIHSDVILANSGKGKGCCCSNCRYGTSYFRY